MAEKVEVVIKIPKVFYEALKQTELMVSGQRSGKTLMSVIYNAVGNGTPLPKGHGRLIDADKLDRIMYRKAFETDSDMQKWDSGCWIRYKMFENSMEEMPTIIEADAESEGRNDN